MKRRRGALYGAVAALSLLWVSACGGGRSSSLRSTECCAAYQRTDPLPDQPGQGVIRLAIGGDSRNDHSHVVPWAFKESVKRGAKAFIFLGDLEITRVEDKFFAAQLADLAGVPFYPVVGDQWVEILGPVRLPSANHTATHI